MPPRFVYWTILIDGKPTAFRARDQQELLPTLGQLKRTNQDVVMKWFARGKLWDSPEAERAADQRPAFTGEKRGADWRPGGAHKDPRDRFKKKNRPERAWSESDRPPHRDRDKLGPPREGKPWRDKPAGAPRGDRPWSAKPPGPRKPWRPKPTGERKPWSAAPQGERAPWRGKPAGPRKPWAAKPPGERKPWGARPQGPRKPWSPKPPGDKKPWSGKPAAGRKPWTAKPAGERKPWSSKPSGPRKPWRDRPEIPKRRDDEPDKK